MEASAVPTSTIDVQFQLTPNDFVLASWAHMKASGITWFVILFIGILNFAAGIYELVTDPAHPVSFSLFLGFFGTVIFPLTIIWGPRRSFRTQPSAGAPQTFHADDNGLAIQSPAFTGTDSWSMYLYFLESSHHFILYLSPRLWRIIPIRAFTSAQQLEQFRQLLSQPLRPRGFRWLL